MAYSYGGQPGGMLAAGPGNLRAYPTGNAPQPTQLDAGAGNNIPVNSWQTGLESLANTALQDYFRQKQQGSPAQLASAAPSGLSGMISQLLRGAAPASAVVAPVLPDGSGIY